MKLVAFLHVCATLVQTFRKFSLQTDGYDKTQSWYLDSVTITNMKMKQTYYFPCSDWLSLYHEGETLVRQFQAAEKEVLQRSKNFNLILTT